MMRRFVFTLHKYISLVLCFVWLLQLLSGVVLVFAPEITDAKYSKPPVAFDPMALEKSIERVASENPDWEPSLVFTTGKESSRFDIYFYHENSDEIGSRAFRIDGDGEVLADRMMKWDILNRLAEFHEMLWIDNYGYIILGISGLFLCTNMIFGLVLIWPSRRRWLSFFRLPAKAPVGIKLYSWHRLLGLCLLIPGFFVVFTGVLNIWLGDMKDIWGDPWAAPHVVVEDNVVGKDYISLSSAVGIAFQAYPGATLSILALPNKTDPYFMVRLRQEGEIREIYGNTKLYISAYNGEVLANYNQLNAPMKAQVFSSFFTLHLGDFWGIAGRVIVFLTGIGLLAMGIVGIMLWWKRRSVLQRGVK